jgi:hypothetical protein
VARPEGWLIRQNQDGTCDVFLDRRPCVYDRYDVDEAIQWILRSPQWGGQAVVMQDKDGWPTKLEVRR